MLFRSVLVALVATSYATSNRQGVTPVYMKLSQHCSAASSYDSDTPAAGAVCIANLDLPNGDVADGPGTLTSLQTMFGKTSPVHAQFLVALQNADMDNLDQINMAGTCINFKKSNIAGNVTMEFYGAVPDTSMKFVYSDDAAVDTATLVLYSGINCQGATVAVAAQGFNWGANSTSGAHAVAGDIAGLTAANNFGLDLGTAIDKDTAEFSAVRWNTKKAFVGQLVGPYSTDKCRGLDSDAATGIFLPIVVPIEAADAASGFSKYNEPAVSSSIKCRSMRADLVGSTAGEAAWYGTEISATQGAGTLTITHSSGVAAELDDGATLNPTKCAAGATYHKVTFTMTWDGKLNNCQQAVNNSGNPVSAYYKFFPNVNTVSNWPSTAAAPTTTCNTTTSPASGLHTSTFMAVAIALIALML